MPTIPGTLLTTRRVAFPIMIMIYYLMVYAPIEKIFYILKDAAWRTSVDEERLKNGPQFFDFMDAEGFDSKQRAFRAATSTLAHIFPGKYRFSVNQRNEL